MILKSTRCLRLSLLKPSAVVDYLGVLRRKHRHPLQREHDGADLLTKGKLNAVRAAFKAGVRPSAIARQFGISQSDVRKALATEGRDRKSWG